MDGKYDQYDLVPLVSPRLTMAKERKVVWEWQCDHEDDVGMEMPPMQESQKAIRTPYESDKLAEFWAASLTEEVQMGPLAFVEAIWFQSIVGVVIAVNAIIIGLETDLQSRYWGSIENALLVFFVLELLLRVGHHGPEFLVRSFGNVFDLLIVCAGVFDMWLVPIMDFINGVEQSRRSAFMSAIQMLRLLRIIRLVRLVKIVQPLYRLALGIAEAIQGMFWVLIFLAMMLYAMAILLTRLIGRTADGRPVTASDSYDGPRAQDVCSGGCSLAALDVPADQVRVLFQSVFSSMFVLFESMSCWSLMRFAPLFERMPGLKLAGVLFYIFAAWALLAVMTGVVSEKMIAAREKINSEAMDRANERSGMAMQVIENLFHRADADGSGEISREEFNTMLMWTDITKQLMEHTTINAQDLNELFEWLDHDKDGMVSIKEFMDGFRWLNDTISPKSFLKLQEEAAVDIRNLEKTLVGFANARFDALIGAVLKPLRKIHAVTEQIQRLELQLCMGGGGFGGKAPGAETLDSLCADLKRHGPPTREALEEFERRISKRLDKLLEMVDRLDRLQAKGLVRLKR